MEAARVAALRGHKVTLYEKEQRLGGSLPIATLIKGSDIFRFQTLNQYLHNQIAKLGVTIILGKEFSLKDLEEIKPDTVILATGEIVDRLDLNFAPFLAFFACKNFLARKNVL